MLVYKIGGKKIKPRQTSLVPKKSKFIAQSNHYKLTILFNAIVIHF